MIPFIILAIENPDDREFMEKLYTSYNRLMLSEIRKYVWTDWDAEDILQSVLVKLIDKLPLLRSFERNQRVNYIIVASRNTALNYLRDKKRRAALSYDEDFDWTDDRLVSNDERLEWIERIEDVGSAWHALDERSRSLLEMKYILEQSNEEIAKEIGVGVDSVRMLLVRARRKLKDSLLAAEMN